MVSIEVFEPRYHLELGEVSIQDWGTAPGACVRGVEWSFARAAFTYERALELAVELASIHEHVRLVDREADGEARVLRAVHAVREFLPASDESANCYEHDEHRLGFDGLIDVERLVALVLAAANGKE
ncbi:hypothetical protein ACXR2W_00935 [Leucobacter sp. HY1908]